MGFGKKSDRRPDDDFKPSSKADLKRYAELARKREAGKAVKVVINRGKNRTRDPMQLLERMRRNEDVMVLQDRLFDALVEFAKENHTELPAFRAYLPRSEAVARFMFEMQVVLAKLSWVQLAKTIHAATDVPVPIRDWSEAFHHALNLVFQTFGCKDVHKGGEYEIDDDALANWPVEQKHKRTKKEVDTMSKQDFAAVKANKMKAAALGDDEEEEELDEGEEEETEEEEDDEEEAMPPKSQKKPAKGFGGKSAAKPEKKEKEVKKPVKSEKTTKPAKKAPAEKRERSTAETKFTVKKKFTGGVREKAQSVILSKGATMETIQTLAKKRFDMPPAKTKSYINWLAANGYLNRE